MMTRKEAARIGGLARAAKYGSPGTAEGRRLGGLRSMRTHMKNKTGFYVLRKIKTPRHSRDLAEMLGIAVGDGGLTRYQLTITTNSETDREHARHSQRLLVKLFGVSASMMKRKGENTLRVVVSSKALVTFLNVLGMPIGNKIKNNIGVPGWIYSKKGYKKAFLRGLFDTDGCVYLDKHRIRGRLYRNMGWTITSYSAKLCLGVISLLKDLGFSPTQRSTQKSIYLRKRRDIERYFSEIGTSNKKHLVRYNNFK